MTSSQEEPLLSTMALSRSKVSLGAGVGVGEGVGAAEVVC